MSSMEFKLAFNILYSVFISLNKLKVYTFCDEKIKKLALHFIFISNTYLYRIDIFMLLQLTVINC